MIRTGCCHTFGLRRGASDVPHLFGFQCPFRKHRSYAPQNGDAGAASTGRATSNPVLHLSKKKRRRSPYASKKQERRYNRLRSAFGALHGELPLRPSRSPAQRQGHDLGFRQISRRAKPDAIAPVRSLPQTERFVLTFNNILLQR